MNSKKNTRGPWNINTSSKPSAAQSTKDQEKDKASELNGKKVNAVPKKQAENVYQRPNLSKCFCCGQSGHLFNACPKRKTVAILEENEDYIEEQ